MDYRLKKLRSEMTKQKLEAVFVSSLPNIIYLTGFSGFSKEDRDAFLLVTKKQQYIFTHGIYKDAANKFIDGFDLIEMKRENPTSKSLKTLVTKHKIKSMGFEAFDLKVSEYERLLKFINKKSVKPTKIVDGLREIKSTNEIQMIRNACTLGDKAYSHVLKKIRIGMTEKEVAFEIEYFIKKNGGEVSFPTIVAFGENAAYIHHQTGNKKLKASECVLLDFGVKLENYCSDMSRSIFLGIAPSEYKKAYQTVLTSQQKAIDYIDKTLKKKNRVLGSNADKVAREHLVSEGFPDLPYSLGHGIGLEVHESPRLTPAYKQNLENGMVFSIEPGIYLTDKFGIRIEDLFSIENNKLIPLTRSTKDIHQI